MESKGDSTGVAATQRPTYEATIERIVEPAADTRSLVLRLPERQRFAFKPGQFLSCLLPIDQQTLIRPYSLASSPEEAELEIVLNRVAGGPGSAYLFGLRVGATLRFTGPWGTFTLDRAPAAETVFLADETGLAPIRPMLHRALATATHPVQLLHAARVPLWHDELARLAQAHARFTFVPLPPGMLASEAQRRFADADADRSRHFYICGVGTLVTGLRDRLRAVGYERRAVQYEKW